MRGVSSTFGVGESETYLGYLAADTMDGDTNRNTHGRLIIGHRHRSRRPQPFPELVGLGERIVRQPKRYLTRKVTFSISIRAYVSFCHPIGAVLRAAGKLVTSGMEDTETGAGVPLRQGQICGHALSEMSGTVAKGGENEAEQ